jgi:hypothetical protein
VHPLKELSEALISRGTFAKMKPGEKPNLPKVTVVALE